VSTSFIDIALNNEGVQGSITVGLTATEAKVGASTLANRQALTVQHLGNQRLYWGYTSGVTTSTGTEIFKNQVVTFEIELPLRVYLISNNASQEVRITEAS
jgi:hypothetical protein